MQPLLESLSTMPGVVGSLVCAQDGRLLAHAFPAVFDEAALREAATVLADGATGLETVTGPISIVDLRYAQARMIVRPMTGGHLLLLCAPSVNVPALVISLTVATKKIEKLMAEPPAEVEEDVVLDDPSPAVEAPPAEAPSAEPGKPKGKTWWPSV